MTEEEQFDAFMQDQVSAWMEQVAINEDIKVPKSVLEWYFRKAALAIAHQPVRFLR